MSIIPRPSSVFRPSLFPTGCPRTFAARVLRNITVGGLEQEYFKTLRLLGRMRAKLTAVAHITILNLRGNLVGGKICARGGTMDIA
jgi:hypothetical protein